MESLRNLCLLSVTPQQTHQLPLDLAESVLDLWRSEHSRRFAGTLLLVPFPVVYIKSLKEGQDVGNHHRRHFFVSRVVRCAEARLMGAVFSGPYDSVDDACLEIVARKVANLTRRRLASHPGRSIVIDIDGTRFKTERVETNPRTDEG